MGPGEAQTPGILILWGGGEILRFPHAPHAIWAQGVLALLSEMRWGPASLCPTWALNPLYTWPGGHLLTALP